MKKNKQIIVGAVLIAVFVFMALAAPLLAPHDPNTTNLSLKNAAPSVEYPLGCDQMGRCELSRLLYGARYSLGLSIPLLTALAVIALFVGCYNGGYGKLSTIIDDAVVTDENTVELHLTQPYYGTMRELRLANPWGIVSSEQLNDDLTAKDTFKSGIYGTGPYMYTGDGDGQTFNFEKNPNYWGDAPDVDSFTVKNIPDNDAKLLALKNGEVDFYTGITKISTEAFLEMSQTNGFLAKSDTDNSLQIYYMGYNLSDPVFGDQTVREAVAMAIDKDAIVDNIFGGLYERADTFFARTLPYCNVEQKVYEFDVDAANSLLDEAGYLDTDGDGIREKDGVKMSATFAYQTGSASDDDTVVYICDQSGKAKCYNAPCDKDKI